MTTYHKTSCSDNLFQHSCQKIETSVEAEVKSERDQSPYKFVIEWFVFVVRVVDMSGSAHQIPAKNWIAEPLFLGIYLRPLHSRDRSDFFLIVAE